MKKATLIVLSCLIITIVTSSCNKKETHNQNSAIANSKTTNTSDTTTKIKAPEIELKEIYNKPDNILPTLTSLKGKIVILDFWATWCAPCIEEFPKNNALYNKYKDKGVHFIAVTDDPKEKVENFLKNVSLDFWIGRIGNQTSKDYKIRFLPSIKIINTDGDIVFEGLRITEELIQEVLETNTIISEKKTEPITENNTKLNEIAFTSGFSPGEDPLYIDFVRQILKKETTPKANLSSLVIRKSPYTKGTYGSQSDTKKGYVGATIVGQNLSDIYKFIKLGTGTVNAFRIKNKSKNTDLYDIVYSKKQKGNSREKAMDEIQNELMNSLSIEFKTIESKQLVNKLKLASPSQYITTKDKIEDGATKLYTPIEELASQFEDTSNEFFVIDTSLKNVLIYSYDIDLKVIEESTDPLKEIQTYLQDKGITINKTEELVQTFEIIDSQ
ncbi:TlpA disulfide reductase family protein [Aquimarina sp. AU58]|uniref:TlpA family protein disulfide reductase n=1 Tax=Aquimarina sp. AU58 TaxID=1874112 RepID=UPI000D65A909|nr:TlpA disulfide reductase family protein [Aquimarina sp. AU58]